MPTKIKNNTAIKLKILQELTLMSLKNLKAFFVKTNLSKAPSEKQ